MHERISMMKKIAVLVVALLLLIIIGASWYFSTEIIYPKEWECPLDHFLYCGDPSELGLDFEDITFSSDGKVEISGWYIPSAGSNRAVVMLHGHGASRHEGLRWATALHRSGLNLLLIDLRSHGESTPGPISMGYHERKDVIAAVDYLVMEKNNASIGVFGVSMGSATGIMAMAADERIQAGIFEAGFADLEELLSDIAKNNFGLPKYPLIPIVVKIFEWRTKADAGMIKPYKTVKEIAPRPVFIIHCEKDDYIPYAHGKKIYEAAGEPKQFWASPCERHAQAWQGDREKAEALVTEYFTKYLE